MDLGEPLKHVKLVTLDARLLMLCGKIRYSVKSSMLGSSAEDEGEVRRL